MRNLLQDLRFAARMLSKSPLFAAVAMLSLALGVAANTATFSIVNAVVLRPYPFPELDRLVLIRPTLNGTEAHDPRLAVADFLDLSSQSQIFQGAAAYRFSNFNLARGGEVDGAEGFSVSPEMFKLIGASAHKGRLFQPEEGQSGRNNVVLLSYGLWQRRFGGDPATVGSTVAVDGENCTVIGVMPEHFIYPAGAEMWKPLALSAAERSDRSRPALYMLARLAPGMSYKSATQAIAAAGAQLQHNFPATNASRNFGPIPLKAEQYEATVPLLLMLQVAAAFVLVLATANLLNLLLMRALGRRRELAVRSALGASRFRLVQLFTCETALLACMAGAAAILGSIWSVQAIRNSLSRDYTKWIAGWQNMSLDRATVIFSVSATLAMALLLGVVTGASAARAPFQEGLKQGGRAGGGFRESRVRSVLVIVQIAMAVALLAGSGLMITGFHRLQGFFASLQPERLLRFTVSLPESRYAQASSVNNFYQRLLISAGALPGVRSAGMITNPPASNVDSPRAQFTIEGRAIPRPADMPSADRQYISAQTLAMLNVPLIEGRMLAEQDGPEAPRVAVISQSLARLYWPGESALNQRIRFAPTEAPVTIVGVVGELRINWADRNVRPTVYLPYAQALQRRFTFLVRTEGEPLNLAPQVRQLVWRQDAALALNGVGPFTQEVEDTLAPIRVLGMLVMAFGLVSLCLAAIGLYGAIAYSVLQRRHEFGVRMALGAEQTDVLSLVLGNVLKLALAGLVTGLVLAFILMRVTTGLVYGAVAFNAVVFGLVTATMLAIALVSGFVPARSASRVDPAEALQAE